MSAAESLDFARTGPATLMGRYMRMYWQPVYLARELQTGHLVPIRIMGEDYTLYRGESGSPHVVAARCAHRGTVLSTGWVEGDDIRCFYHGWKYDATGQCTEQPFEKPEACADVRIRAFPTEEYLGFVFAWFGEGEPPPLPRYPDFETFPGEYVPTYYFRDCNFFQTLENNHDTAHAFFVHARPPYRFRQEELFLTYCEESSWGTSILHKRFTDGSVDQVHVDNPSENVDPVGAGYQFGFPNILHVKGNVEEGKPVSWTDLIAWRVPADDEGHHSFSLFFYLEGMRKRTPRKEPAASVREVGNAILKGKLRYADVMDSGHPDLVNIQDHIALCGQGAIADRSEERLGRSDLAIVQLRRIWARELKALAESRPTKRWTRPDWMRVGLAAPVRERE